MDELEEADSIVFFPTRYNSLSFSSMDDFLLILLEGDSLMGFDFALELDFEFRLFPPVDPVDEEDEADPIRLIGGRPLPTALTELSRPTFLRDASCASSSLPSSSSSSVPPLLCSEKRFDPSWSLEVNEVVGEVGVKIL
jgi:hypothetical protein